MKRICNAAKDAVLSFRIFLRDMNMRTTLSSLFIFFLVSILLLPLSLMGLQTSRKIRWEREALEKEALFNLQQAQAVYDLNEDFSHISQSIYAEGILLIKDNYGTVLYSSAPGLNLPEFRSGYKSRGSYTLEDKIVFYQKLDDKATAFYAAAVQTPLSLWSGFLRTSGIYLFLFVLIFFFIKKKIFDPIITIETVLKGMSKGKTDFCLDSLGKSRQLSSIFQELDALLNNMQQLMLRESNAQLMKKQAEFDALQSQINPHFLYNTLDCIRGQAVRYGIGNIEVMTRALSKLFRYSISNHNATVTLEEELNNVESYLLIQQMRFNNKFVKEAYIDDDARDCIIPKLIIQPIIENAIHHGLETKIGRGLLVIRAYITEQRLIINVKDDGCGISQPRLEIINAALESNSPIENSETNKISVGLMNVNSRIKLTYGNMYGLNVYSTQDIGTDVQLNLPLLKN